jgi:hypothetical protein
MIGCTSMRVALLVTIFVLACGGTPAPVTRPTTQQRLELVEGTPTTLPDGLVVEVKGVGYMHLADSKNLSSCTLVLRRGTEQSELPLAREHGGSDPESSGDALGWRFTLEVADPYHRPSRATVAAEKL